jgi:hypothetical protein
MAQPESASTIRNWMEHLAESASTGRLIETSAGAGPDFDYAYLHFRTADGAHSALVLRAVMVDGEPRVRIVQVDSDAQHIQELVDEATHGQAA